MKLKLLSIAGIVIGIDQVTKYWADHQGLTQLNAGFSLGLFTTSNQALLIFFTVAIMVFLWFCCKDIWIRLPLIAGLLFGGGLANIVDRIIFGGVRDWLPIPGFALKNNIADWAISLSLISLILLELYQQLVQKETHGD